MPSFYVVCPARLSLLALGCLLASSCVNHHFFQPDARIGPGSTGALPAGADSVTAVAGRQYNQRSGLHRAVWGQHYRGVWAAPVRVAVLDLATAAPGGLLPGKAGGGYQSISMTLDGANGREYALRALDKEPYKTLSKGLRHTFVLNVVRDATSAALPYGAFVVPPLAQAAGVPHTRPRLVYVRPDETGLGAMSARFAGKLALLEEKYEALASRTPDLAGARAFLSSEQMLKKVYANPAHAIDQRSFLRARLLDVWLGDWDRHERQWQWAAFGAPGRRVRYLAIPKDRDQVFFRFDDGLIPWLAARPFIAPKFQTFRPAYDNVAGLVKQALFIDQRGLAALTRPDFQRMAAELQQRLPDSVIERALRRLPPAGFALEGPALLEALRARREALPQAADAFYLTLARAPALGGTAQPERFAVHRYPDSTVVRVFSAAPGPAGTGDSLRFARTYYGRETCRISIEGLGGDDVFEVHTTGGGRPIALCLYGGSGHDQLRLQGSPGRIKTYDQAPDLNAAGAPTPRPPRPKRPPYDRLSDD